jgi:hypothetical protein
MMPIFHFIIDKIIKAIIPITWPFVKKIFCSNNKIIIIVLTASLSFTMSLVGTYVIIKAFTPNVFYKTNQLYKTFYYKINNIILNAGEQCGSLTLSAFRLEPVLNEQNNNIKRIGNFEFVLSYNSTINNIINLQKEHVSPRALSFYNTTNINLDEDSENMLLKLYNKNINNVCFFIKDSYYNNEACIYDEQNIPLIVKEAFRNTTLKFLHLMLVHVNVNSKDIVYVIGLGFTDILFNCNYDARISILTKVKNLLEGNNIMSFIV